MRCGLIAHKVEDLPHMRNWRSMRQVSAMREVHCQHSVAGIEKGEIACLVHRRSGKRLDIGVLGAEKRTSAITRDVLDRVRILLAAVIASAWIAFGVFVGQDRAK